MVRGAIGVLVGLLVGLAGLLYIIPLALFTLFCVTTWDYPRAAVAWIELKHFLLNTLGWIIQGFGQVLHGATQIGFAPLTWLSMLVRGPLTALIAGPAIIETVVHVDPSQDLSNHHRHASEQPSVYVDPNNPVVTSQVNGLTQPVYMDVQQSVVYASPVLQPLVYPLYFDSNQPPPSYGAGSFPIQPPVYVVQQPQQPADPSKESTGVVGYSNSPPASY